MEKYPDYSVLMSIYKNDKAEFVKDAIDSMLNQTVLPEQIVLVEDGPLLEEVEKLILCYKKEYPTIFTVIRLLKNGGLGNALNVGMKECRNELIARMDADDISLPKRCEKQLQRFALCPALSILGTQVDEFIGKPSHIVSKRTVPVTFDEIKQFSKRRSAFNHPTVMYKKSVITRLGGYTTLCRQEDLVLFVLAVNKGVYAENLGESLLLYRTSVNNQRRRKTWVNCKEYIRVMYAFYKKGYLGSIDLLYVVVGQLTLYLAPLWLVDKLTKSFLRN